MPLLSEADLSGADLNYADLRRADLRGANLSEAKLDHADLLFANLKRAKLDRTHLKHANLRGANLGEAKLDGAELDDANLIGADLQSADLQYMGLNRANLREANLRAARLYRADLTGANVSKATLYSSNLNGVYLNKADLSGAFLENTTFVNVDLTDAVGLDSCVHDGPSALDHRTLGLSGRLPLPFLRGCGLPDLFIEYLPSLLNDPILFYSCFISYSSRDQDFAERLHADLQNKGVRCWFASHDIKGGRKIHEQIDEAIRFYDRLLLILSEASMASEWVKTEIAHARQKELNQNRQVLFPISLVPYTNIREWKCFDADTGKDSAREIREYHIPDFSDWKNHDQYQKAFERLVTDLKAEGSADLLK
jgi:hypothetical protein